MTTEGSKRLRFSPWLPRKIVVSLALVGKKIAETGLEEEETNSLKKYLCGTYNVPSTVLGIGPQI